MKIKKKEREAVLFLDLLYTKNIFVNLNCERGPIIMVKQLTGASNVTEYQLKKFSQANGIKDETILNLYLKYAIEYDVQVDVAYIMCLVYTDFLKNPIENNNIVGIGTQNDGTKLEEFFSIEECVMAHCEIIQKVSTDRIIDKPHSNLYRRLSSDIVHTSEEVYNLFDYGSLTSYSIYEYSRFLRELNRTRKEKVGWASNTQYYYYIRVKSSKSKSEIIRLRSDLINKKFEPESLYITAKDGVYTLEAGRYTNPINVNALLHNLQLFGYNGSIEYRVEKFDS